MENSCKFPESISHRISTQNKNDNSRKEEKPFRNSIQITKNNNNNQLTNNANDNSNMEIEKKVFYDVHISGAQVAKRSDEVCNKLNEKSIIFVQESKLKIEMNRLLYSKNCITIYILLLIVSISILIYSIISYFQKYNELPIILVEIMLTIIVCVDMSIRIFVIGCLVYFTKIINFLDIFLLICSFVSIVLYFKYRDQIEKIEDITFGLLILIRNLSQLLRLIVLLKNQNEVRKNIDQFIHFSSIFEDKKPNNITDDEKPKYSKNLNLHALSFVEEDIEKKKEIKNSIENLDYNEKNIKIENKEEKNQ